MILKPLTKSKAVLASSPRVELSHDWMRALVAIISAMETRFRSPPLTPRTNSLPTRVDSVCETLSIRRRRLRTSTLNSSFDTPGRRPPDPGVFVERAKSRVCPTVNVGIWISSGKPISERNLSAGAVHLTFLIIHHLAFVVFEHLRMGNTGVSDITLHIEIRPTFVGDNLEESGASRPWSTENEDHLTRSQNARVSRRRVRMQGMCFISETHLWMIFRTGGTCNSLFGRIGWRALRRTTKGKVTSSVTASIRKVSKNL